MIKPNFDLVCDGTVVRKVYLNHVTGKIIDELGYDYPQPRSDKFWDEYTFEPISGSGQAQEVKDNVNNPSHYGQGSIEAIDYINDMLTEEEWIGYLRGNIAKYMHRFRYKNGVEDLEKAQWYLNKLIETQKENV